MSECIVCVGVGHWYPKGVKRLADSLNYHGWAGSTMFWSKDYPKGCPPHSEVPYAMKVYAFREAFDAGHTSVLWLDSSCWCIRYPTVHVQAMGRDGYYLVHSGWQCDQWTNDNCLNYFGLSREEAREIPMISGGILGINITTEIGREFFARYAAAMEVGAFKGSWTATPEEGSGDRYRGHRHDQSCASIIAHQLGMKIHPEQVYDYYASHEMPETVEIALRGM